MLCPRPLRQPGLERVSCALPISKEAGHLRKNLLDKGLLLVTFLDNRKPLGSASCENAQILGVRCSHKEQGDKDGERYGGETAPGESVCHACHVGAVRVSSELQCGLGCVTVRVWDSDDLV